MLRQDLPWLLQAHRGAAVPAEPNAGSGREVLDGLRGQGALFHSDLQAITRRLPTEVEEGLWDGVARGLITADGFNAVRSLLHARTRFARRQRPHPRPGSRGRRGTWRQGVEGRWTLLPAAAADRRHRGAGRNRCLAALAAMGRGVSRRLPQGAAWPFRGARSSGRCAGSRPGA